MVVVMVASGGGSGGVVVALVVAVHDMVAAVYDAGTPVTGTELHRRRLVRVHPF